MSSAAAPTDSATATPPQHKHIRVLACVLCQHRKIKCDRNTPCSNCVKANVTCTPSTPAPARKRRRPNQDLQERLARCEKLLQQYAANGSPPPADVVATLATPAPTSTTKTEATESSAVGGGDFPNWKTSGRIVQENSGGRFMDSHIWASMVEELQGMRALMETEDTEDSSIMSPEEQSPDEQADLLLAENMASVSMDDLLPEPVHIFRLWQIFLDRVNPLTKVIHVPSVQPYIMDIASNLTNVPLNYQALLFSIFSMAVVSLTQVETVQLLGITREKALVNFNRATKTALIRSNFLKQFNMTSLQALLLYMQSLEGRWDRHAAWVLGGTVVRIAQKMGYHRDGEQLKLNPFETEMRRRIWWQLLMHDSKLAHLSGLNMTLLPQQWDTKEPSNINDADLFPGSSEPVQAREGPTEMVFVMMMYEMLKFNLRLDNSNHGSLFEAALLGQAPGGEEASASDTAALFSKFREQAKDLEDALYNIEQKYCDPSAGNVHIAALTLRPQISCHLDEILLPLKEHAEYGTEIFGPDDVLFKLITLGNEHRAESFDQMAKSGFRWFVRLNFQDEIFAVLTTKLAQRTSGSLVDRAWTGIEKTYKIHSELFDMTQKQYAAQAQITLRAWKNREATLAQSGWPVETPGFIKQLKELVPETTSSTPGSANPSQAAAAAAAAQSMAEQQPAAPQPPFMQTQPPPQGMLLDPFVGNYMESSGFNWDMLNDMMPNSGADQFSASMMTGYGMPNSSNMGNMGGGMGPM